MLFGLYLTDAEKRERVLSQLTGTQQELWAKYAAQWWNVLESGRVFSILSEVDKLAARLGPTGDLGIGAAKSDAGANAWATAIDGAFRQQRVAIDLLGIPAYDTTAQVQAATEAETGKSGVIGYVSDTVQKAAGKLELAGLPREIAVIVVALAVIFVAYFLIQALSFTRAVRAGTA